eukprot:4172763-Pyramimonas_sp.AAC.1
MQEIVHQCEKAAPPELDVTSNVAFTREPNHTIFVATAKEPVAMAAIRECVAPWLAEGGFTDEQWKLEGDSPGRRFIIQFLGAEGFAARHVHHAFKHLKLASGEWR